VEAVTAWSPADDGWLNAPGGFLRGDNSVKPVYTALYNKVKGEWWTKKALRSGADGGLRLEGFRGDYELDCGGKKIPFTLDGTRDRIELRIE
jgi:hypothetical protein